MMVGIENSYTLGKRYVISTIDALKASPVSSDNKAYFPHPNKLPYEIDPNNNSICPFCADMIKRKIDEGNRSGYPFPEDEHTIRIGQHVLTVTTRVNIDSIEHLVEY